MKGGEATSKRTRAKQVPAASASIPQAQNIGSTTNMASNAPTRPPRINFAAVGQLLPPSIYSAVVDTWKYGTTTTDKPMWSVAFKITDDEKYNNRKVFRNFIADGEALFYFMEALVNMGVDPDELYTDEVDEDGNPSGVDIEPLVNSTKGAHVRLHLSTRSFDDKKQPQNPDGSYPQREVNNIDKIEAI